jgi:hypothetical protein
MKSVFDEFSNLWPESNHKSLKAVISDVSFLYYPEEKHLIYFVNNISKVIIIVNKATLQELIFLINKGFEHIVQKNRTDFAQELLVSCLMALKPKAFVSNPIPFFFSGFQDPKTHTPNAENNMQMTINSSGDKSAIIEKFYEFLNSREKLQAISELSLQIADELITNAIFSVPGKNNKTNANNINFPLERPATFFCCYTDYRIIVGCEDQHGAFKKNLFLHYLKLIFNEEKVKPKQNLTGGAGLGFKFLIENSANIYLFCQDSQKSLVGCGLAINSIKSNLSQSKNLHFSFS